jgi:signal recognition particle subunit SEC65
MVKLTEQEGPDAQGDRRLVLFAVYFDAKKTVAQGRKVSAAAASENPSLRDIAECLAALRIPFEFQARPAREHGRRARAAGLGGG